MIAIMSLHQLYKQYQLIKVKKIYRYDNLAKFIIKTKILLALKTMIDTNYINISTTQWIKQASIK